MRLGKPARLARTHLGHGSATVSSQAARKPFPACHLGGCLPGARVAAGAAQARVAGPRALGLNSARNPCERLCAGPLPANLAMPALQSFGAGSHPATPSSEWGFAARRQWHSREWMRGLWPAGPAPERPVESINENDATFPPGPMVSQFGSLPGSPTNWVSPRTIVFGWPWRAGAAGPAQTPSPPRPAIGWIPPGNTIRCPFWRSG